MHGFHQCPLQTLNSTSLTQSLAISHPACIHACIPFCHTDDKVTKQHVTAGTTVEAGNASNTDVEPSYEDPELGYRQNGSGRQSALKLSRVYTNEIDVLTNDDHQKQVSIIVSGWSSKITTVYS